MDVFENERVAVTERVAAMDGFSKTRYLRRHSLAHSQKRDFWDTAVSHGWLLKNVVLAILAMVCFSKTAFLRCSSIACYSVYFSKTAFLSDVFSEVVFE
jgi:hypothetical protein